MKLEIATEKYLTALSVEGKSTNTIEFYRSNLTVFVRWLGKAELEEVQASDVRCYLHYLQTEHIPYGAGHPLHQPARHLAPHSIKGHWATLSAFFRWAEGEGMLKDNPMLRIPRPKVPKKIKAGLTEQEVRGLLKACETKGGRRAARDHAILLFLLDTGCRVSELCDIELADLDAASGRVKVRGKGAKERFVYIGQTTRRAMLKYLDKHRLRTADTHLFLTHDGRKLGRYGVASMLSRLGDRAKVPGVHAHRFRHTAAVQLLRNGSDIFHLQRMLGHSTLDMVKAYLALADADVARAHQRASPVENWGLR